MSWLESSRNELGITTCLIVIGSMLVTLDSTSYHHGIHINIQSVMLR
jgi:hypothetical protein